VDLEATLPDAVRFVLPDAAHSPQLDTRDAFLCAFGAHLERAGG
jgi:hypothetical protein